MRPGDSAHDKMSQNLWHTRTKRAQKKAATATIDSARVEAIESRLCNKRWEKESRINAMRPSLMMLTTTKTTTDDDIYYIKRVLREFSWQRTEKSDRGRAAKGRAVPGHCATSTVLWLYDDDDKLLSRQKRISIRTSNLPELSLFSSFDFFSRLRGDTKSQSRFLFLFHYSILIKFSRSFSFNAWVLLVSTFFIAIDKCRVSFSNCHFAALLCATFILYSAEFFLFISIAELRPVSSPLSPPVAVIVDFVFFLPRAPELLIAKSNFRQFSRQSFWKWNEITWKCHDNYI